MPRRINEVFGVPEDDLVKEGVFNAFVDIDSKLYVDPHLLASSAQPELQGAYDTFRSYFQNIITLIQASKRPGDSMFREAVRRLTFREIPNTSLGYSSTGNLGSGIGRSLAQRLAVTAKEIIEAGISDPTIFELIGLLEEDVGADRVSDMTVQIILPHLLAYSQRVARNLKLPTRSESKWGATYELPIDPDSGSPIILVPQDILRNLPVAHDWSDIDYVCQHNAELRKRVNETIGDTWREATRRLKKRELRDVLLRNPEAFKDLIAQYRAKPADAYDFDLDPAGEVKWYDIAKDFSEQFPLDLKDCKPKNPEEVLHLVLKICKHFKNLMEFNGLAEMLWVNGKLRHERFAQLLFYAIADAYCKANDVDLSREPNAGRGPVDFKFSRGFHAKVTVEVKYTSNNIIAGLEKQLPEYNKAEQSVYSVYMVIITTKKTASLDELIALRNDRKAAGTRLPEIVVIDGRPKPPASKVR